MIQTLIDGSGIDRNRMFVSRDLMAVTKVIRAPGWLSGRACDLISGS